MPSTYDLLATSRSLLDMVETEGGALTVEAEAVLQNFITQSEDKVLACLTVIRRADAEADLLKEEEVRLAKRRKAFEATSDRVRELAADLLMARESLGESPKVKTAQYTAWLQDTDSLVGPEDVTDWPAEWTRTKVEPDKKAAMASIKSTGLAPRGFSVAVKRGLRFR